MLTADPWEVMPEIQERPPSTQKTSMAGPLRGGDGDPGASTINAKRHQRRGPWEAVLEAREHPPSTLKISMVTPREAMLEIRERPPSTQKASTKGLLGGDVRDPGVPTINVRNIDSRPTGRW
jgi:hypothetical protein